MTSAPVPLAEQPKNEQDAARLEDLRRRHCSIVSSHPCDEKAIGRWPPCDAAFLLRLLDEARSKLEASNYALDRVREQRVDTLQQHERAMAVVHWAREYADALCNGEEGAVQGGLLNKMSEALDALDGAANTAGDAVTTEEDKQNHGDEDRC